MIPEQADKILSMGPNAKVGQAKDTAHTPGPWKSNVTGTTVLPTAQTGGAICHLIEDDNNKANARLIAAAPETAAERDRLREEIGQCHAKSTCCCGDYMKDHSVTSEHNLISMYDHSFDLALEETKALKEHNMALTESLKEYMKWGPQIPFSNDWDTPLGQAILIARAALKAGEAP